MRDQGPGRRQFGPDAKAAGPDLRDRGRLRGPVRPQRARSARARSNAFAPDVVTLDIHMPQMDGLACLDRIMVEHPCPVVMVSSLTAEGADATLRGAAAGRGRLRRQARRRDLAAHRRADGPSWSPRCAPRPPPGSRSSARLKDRVRHRIGARRHGDPASPPRAVRAECAGPRLPAKAWCWSAPRPADRRRWRRC